MRHIYQGTYKDGNGRRIDAATVSVFLAGTTTAATVYAASSGGSSVAFVTTDSRGSFSFWIDDTEYTQEQLFKYTGSKANFQSSTYDDIEVFAQNRLILDGSNNLFIDATEPRLITLGAERQEHVAGVNGTRAKHLDIKPAGFDDTSGIVIVEDLESSSATIRIKGINFNADVTGATNAHVNALEVSKVGDLGSGMRMDAIDVRGGVDVIDHHSGAVGAAESAFKYDDSGASYTDVTTAFGSAGTDVTIFDADDDVIYIGQAAQFSTVEVILAIVASGAGVKPTFEYSQGASAWNTLSVTDDTNGFRENGNIFYAIPSDWATDTVNAVASKYWVRITRTANSLTTVPTEDTIKVTSSTDYGWDAAGDVTINDLTCATATVNTAFAGTAFLDEDDMASDSATKAASQQSIKAYADGLVLNSSFSVHKNGTNQTTVGTALEIITWSTELFDTNGDFAANRFTPTIARKYLLSATLKFAVVSKDDPLIIAIYKNGALYQQVLQYGTTIADYSISIQTIVDANGSSDYFEVFAANTGTADTVYGTVTDTFFSGCGIP